MKTRTLNTPAGNVQIALPDMKSRQEIEAKIAELESDERVGYPAANMFSNAPLALIQVELKAQIDALKWVLGE